MGVDRVLCAGDVVDYGLFPDETIAILADRRIPTARGNHDRWALERSFRTTSDLSPASRAWLRGLPASLGFVVDGVRVAVHHASPRHDMDELHPHSPSAELAEILDEADADVLIVGHTHRIFDVSVPRGRIVNPGALLRDPGDPLDAPRATASFGVPDLEDGGFTAYSVRTGDELPVERREAADRTGATKRPPPRSRG